ncbi:MAG: hypothetical protein JRE70_07695 [Deltaproteobacteria bacterium]|nr:hypothetical protein [Deltaproteobacteria bacterium]
MFSVALLEWPEGQTGSAPTCLGEVVDPDLVREVADALAQRKTDEAEVVRRLAGTNRISVGGLEEH